MEKQEETKGVKQEMATQKTIIIQQKKEANNGIGIAGFVLSILALVLSCVPFLNFILWILGLIFSIIGLSKEPKGFATAGLVISLLGLIILVLAFLGILGLSTLSTLP